ncbi:MAG: hypothetical protein ACI9W2_004461 [Gammaproteobacteria bacterium]|jgi:hypothetical protein
MTFEAESVLDMLAKADTVERWTSDGVVSLPAVMSAGECDALTALYEDRSTFRSRVVMERHNFGRGEYAYFAYPLPLIIAQLRTRLYASLAGWANSMMEAMGYDTRYPPTHAEFLDRCHGAGQHRATPLLLRYGPGDFNCLHRDLYGDVAFPIQAALFLNEPDEDYGGGEFVLVENRPRQQARVRVLRPSKGDLVIFPNNERPVAGVRRTLRASVRHGVSEVTRGQRSVLGIIFHDAT